jgi:hypothetical protein
VLTPSSMIRLSGLRLGIEPSAPNPSGPSHRARSLGIVTWTSAPQRHLPCEGEWLSPGLLLPAGALKPRAGRELTVRWLDNLIDLQKWSVGTPGPDPEHQVVPG